MVQVTITDETKPLNEVNRDWLTSKISKNRVMGKENSLEINIDSENVELDLFANCERAGQTEASNDIEGRIVFLWDDLVLSKHDLDTGSLCDFLKRMDQWVSFVPQK